MKKPIVILSVLVALNLVLSVWMMVQYKNQPPLEENVRIRVGQSDRIIAENANEIGKMKGEVEGLKREIQELKAVVGQQQNQLKAHESLLRR